MLGLKNFPAIFLIFFLFSLPGNSASNHQYQQHLIEKANQLNLSEDQQWLNMLYYQKKLFGGYESIFDSPNFFLAKNGKINPKAELEATILSFFDSKPLPFKGLFQIFFH